MIKIYFSLDSEGYLEGWSSTRSTEDEISIEVDADNEVLKNPEVFQYIDEELTKDEERQQQLIDEHEREKHKLSADNMNAIAILELAEQIELLKGGN